MDSPKGMQIISTFYSQTIHSSAQTLSGPIKSLYNVVLITEGNEIGPSMFKAYSPVVITLTHSEVGLTRFSSPNLY